MSWDNRLDDDSRTLEIRCAGRLSAEDLTMLGIEASFLAQKHGASKILLDFVDARLAFPAGELSTLFDIYAEYRLPLGTRCGIVLQAIGSSDFAKLMSIAADYGYKVELLNRTQSPGWLAAQS